MHWNKKNNQITTKLWIIKTFWSIYLQDNHCWKDLNYQKRSLIFRIWIKNVSKRKSRLKKPQNRCPKLTKTQTRVRRPRRPFGILGVPIGTNASTARGLLDWDKPYLFWVFRDKDVSQFVSDHSTNFRSIPSFINRGCLSKFSTSNLPSFWLFFFDFSIPLTLKTFWKLLL